MNDTGGNSVNDKDSREIDDIIKRLRESVNERPKTGRRRYSTGSFEQKLAELLEKHLSEKKDMGELEDGKAEYAASDLEIVKEVGVSPELIDRATKPDFGRGAGKAEAAGGSDAAVKEPQPEAGGADEHAPAMADMRPPVPDDLLEPEPPEQGLPGYELPLAEMSDKPDKVAADTTGRQADETEWEKIDLKASMPDSTVEPAGANGAAFIEADGNADEPVFAGEYEPYVTRPEQSEEEEDTAFAVENTGVDRDVGEPGDAEDSIAGFDFAVPSPASTQQRLGFDSKSDGPGENRTPDTQENGAETTSQSKKDQPEISDDEINVMLALGYEVELSSRIGQDKLNDIKQNLTNQKIRNERKPAGSLPFGTEYTSHSQDAGIKQDCRRRMLEAGLRLAGVAFIALLLGLLENLGYFGAGITGLPGPSSPVYFSLISTALLASAAAISYSSFAGGFYGIYRFYPEPHSLSAMAAVLCVVYNLAVIIIHPEEAQLYSFPAALCLVMSATSELLDAVREKKTFEVVSSGEKRYGLKRLESAGDKTPVYNVRCSKFSSGYVRRTNAKKKGIYLLNYTLIPAVAVGIVMAIITAGSTSDAARALGAFMATVLICLPLPVLLLALPPAYEAARLKKQGCAIVGSSGVDEYSKDKLIVFEDSAMFPADCIRTKGLKLYDGFEIFDVLVKVGSLFCEIGGPLGEIFEGGGEKFHRISDIRLVRVERGGVEAEVGGLNMLCGSYDFLEKYGIYPKRNPRDEQLLAAGEVSIIYVAIDQRAAARLYIDYRVDPKFEEAARRLADCNCRVAIRTCDPGIDEEMLGRKRGEGACRVEIIRSAPAGREPDENVDSGIVALGSPYDLALPLCTAAKLSRVRRRTLSLSLGAFILNIILSALLAVTGLIAYAVSGLIALYMLLWILPVCFMTRQQVGS